MLLHHENGSPPRQALPSKAYCIAWMDALTGFLPGTASRQREIITRLSGWASWPDMLAGCNGESGYSVSDLSQEHRFVRLASHRDMLIHEFGIKPAYANHLLWCNPLGAEFIFELNEAHPSALYGASEKPGTCLSEIIAELDRHNLGKLLGSDESIERAEGFIDASVYVALCQFLGWELNMDTESPPVPGYVSVDILGTVQDKELGVVDIYTTGLTCSPEDRYDEPHDLLLGWAKQHQAGKKGPLIILYSLPMVRNLPTGPVSIFGVVVADGTAWSLPLSGAAKNLGDYLIEVMSSPKLDSPPLLDIGFGLARRFIFCKAREHDGLTKEEAQALTVLVHIEGSGWGKMILSAS